MYSRMFNTCVKYPTYITYIILTYMDAFHSKSEPLKCLDTVCWMQFILQALIAGSGLAKFKDNPSAAGTSLMSCLQQAEDDIPPSMHSFSRVYLGATAGMRLLR